MTIFEVLKYIAPPDFVQEKMSNPLRSMLIVGAMNSGKTTWTLSLIARGIQKLLDEGKDDSELGVVHTLGINMHKAIKEVKGTLDLGKLKYLYWFSDDAPAAEGMHSRRSSSSENVHESMFYTRIRHKLLKLGFNGFLFVAHATQVYHLIDITFRRLSKLKVFKDYPDEPADLKVIGPMLTRIYLSKLAEITYKINVPRNTAELVEGLETAVIKFIKEREAIRVSKRDIPASIQYLEIEPEEEENDGNMENGNNIVYELLEKGIKPVRRGNIIYFYRRNNGKLTPLLKIRLKLTN